MSCWQTRFCNRQVVEGIRELLKMIHGREADRLPALEEMIQFKDAAWPVPFKPGLEYNSPCHGTWNIVHIGMAVPQSHQIYVCGANCNRGVVLTAAEMQASDRYSTLTLFEEDLFDGHMDELIIEGVSEIIRKLPQKPRAVFVFTVCVHRFMGIDRDYIYSVLRDRFPEIIFVESFMEPISQKEGLTPDQRLRIGMQSFLKMKEKRQDLITIFSGDFPLDENCQIKSLLKNRGYKIIESAGCSDFDQYMSMGDSSLILCTYPPALPAARVLSRRLDTPYLYMPATFSYEENADQSVKLEKCLDQIGTGTPNKPEESIQQAEAALARAKNVIGDTPVAIDASAVPRYLGLARLLISHGFHVIRLYGDAFSPEEWEDYLWLKRNVPGLSLCATMHHNMRTFQRGQAEKVLAIGQKAAYFHDTPYFVNIVQGGGLHGNEGIRRMADLMVEAYQTEKDTRDLVGRKGLGNKSY